MGRLKNVGYSDGFLHEIIEESGKKEQKRIIFPATRYSNVLNRPVVTESVESSKNPDFLLLSTDSEELDDKDIYELFGQEW